MTAGIRLKVPDEAAGFIRSLHPDIKKKVRAGLRFILTDPLAGKALKEELEGLRSFRVSTFRIIYRIENASELHIVTIGPRSRIYEETYKKIMKKG
ncbi:MAG: type II toxin-antitoxin system RelE family toxin [Thermodesulfovibrionales bacterium]|nr:MAG: type II toxin-antitoxin system RelE/ParE family toxin [Nitrospirota bacterium]